ncbi:hypothetical protein N9L68_03910, partial [bacterium]|nr:hypothetical protein [bacterium]
MSGSSRRLKIQDHHLHLLLLRLPQFQHRHRHSTLEPTCRTKIRGRSIWVALMLDLCQLESTRISTRSRYPSLRTSLGARKDTQRKNHTKGYSAAGGCWLVVVGVVVEEVVVVVVVVV